MLKIYDAKSQYLKTLQDTKASATIKMLRAIFIQRMTHHTRIGYGDSIQSYQSNTIPTSRVSIKITELGLEYGQLSALLSSKSSERKGMVQHYSSVVAQSSIAPCGIFVCGQL